MTQEQANAKVIYRESINETHWIIRVQPDSGNIDLFEPGQYAELGLPDPRIHDKNAQIRFVRRLYSIASANSVKDYLEFYIVAVPHGVVSTELVQLPADGRLFLSEKTKGRFTLSNIEDGKDLVMIATGTGIAPFISMIRSYKDSNRWNSFTLIHGVRYAQDLGYRSELETYAQKYPNFYYIPTVTREGPEKDWNGIQGRVNGIFNNKHFERISGKVLSPQNCQVFLCGNPDMIDSMELDFTSKGFTKSTPTNMGNLHFERYW